MTPNFRIDLPMRMRFGKVIGAVETCGFATVVDSMMSLVETNESDATA